MSKQRDALVLARSILVQNALDGCMIAANGPTIGAVIGLALAKTETPELEAPELEAPRVVGGTRTPLNPHRIEVPLGGLTPEEIGALVQPPPGTVVEIELIDGETIRLVDTRPVVVVLDGRLEVDQAPEPGSVLGEQSDSVDSETGGQRP